MRRQDKGEKQKEVEVPNKKWDKTKLFCLWEDPHLLMNCPRLAEAKRLLIQIASSKQPDVLYDPYPNKG